MSPRRVLAVAQAQVRELLRRRASIVILVLLPLVFYWATSGPFAITFATTGLGWAISIITLFQALSMQAISPRLRLVGFTSLEEFLGRIMCSAIFGAVLAAGLWLYIRTDKNVEDQSSLALAFAFSLLGATALGLASAAIIGREMEATLFLVGVVGLQFPIDPWGSLAKFLPLYASERFSADTVGWETRTLTTVALWTIGVSAVLIVASLIVTRIRAPRPQALRSPATSNASTPAGR